MGRHSAVGEPDEPDEPASATRTVPVASLPAASAGAVSDLRLLMRDRRLLASCAGAVVAIFAVYLAALLSLHRLDDWALFLLVPTAMAGAAIGALLDRADRTLKESASTSGRRSVAPTQGAEPAADHELDHEPEPVPRRHRHRD
jgi:hypothetical protein